MNQTCPKCGCQFDPDAPSIIICSCGYVHQVSTQRDEKNPSICHKCGNSLFWQDGKPVIKTPMGKIIKAEVKK